MIVRKSQKFSLNSREDDLEKLYLEDNKSFSKKHKKKKTAADTATSILEELGVKKISPKKSNNTILNVKRKSSPINKKNILDQKEWDRNILNDLGDQKNIIKKEKERANLENKNKTKQSKLSESEINHGQTENLKVEPLNKFGFQEKFIFLLMLLIIGVGSLGFVGGYLKIFDLAIFRQLISGNTHQLEFNSDFEARKVENGYNRRPLYVVEGSILNTFYASDKVEKIQLKALAFDLNGTVISSHFTLAGVVLSDKQLSTLSPFDIKSLRHSGAYSGINSKSESESSKELLVKSTKGQEVPFQVVFFKDVPSIKRTSLQIVSYIRKNELVYVRATDLN